MYGWWKIVPTGDRCHCGQPMVESTSCGTKVVSCRVVTLASQMRHRGHSRGELIWRLAWLADRYPAHEEYIRSLKPKRKVV